jgi:subtilisin family serine protease
MILFRCLNIRACFLLVTVVLNFNIQAQSNASFELLKFINESNVSSRANSTIHIILKARKNVVKDLEQQGVLQIKYSVTDIHAIKIPVSNLDQLINTEDIGKIEVHNIKIVPHDTKALRQMRVDSVYEGLGTLETNYTGKDVIFGMIDSGIDPASPEFKNEDGSSRILRFWDQHNSSNDFENYGYGRIFTNEDIDNGLLDDYRDTTYNGHGTAVASVAVGGGMIHDSIRGVAPESDIIVVGINDNVLDYTNRVPSMLQIVDAIHYIFTEGEKLGKPVVINISLGGLEGSHDGQDLPTQLIESLLEQKVGRAIVVAAGNAGTVKHHIHFELNNERKYSWFRPMVSNSSVCKRDSGMYMSFYMDSLDATNIDFRVALELIEPCCELYGDTGFKKIIEDNDNISSEIVNLPNQQQAVIKTYVEKIGTTYGLFIEVSSNVEDYLCRVSFEGVGVVDGWSGALDERSCNSMYVSTQYLIGNRDEIENFDNYVRPDKEQNIGTAYACSDKVITVGAFNVRTSFWDVDSTKRSYSINPLERASFSSIGPTRDGKVKPDIMGPGSRIIATNAQQVIEDKLENNRSTVYLSGEHVITDGTSFASPAVAGVVALFFEKYPGAGYRDIKRVMTTTSIQDEYDNEYPNNEYGYGRVNANEMLLYEGNVSVEDVLDTKFNYKVYPNPSNGNIRLVLDNAAVTKYHNINVYDYMGKIIYTDQSNKFDYTLTLQNPGLYYIEISSKSEGRIIFKHLVM